MPSLRNSAFERVGMESGAEQHSYFVRLINGEQFLTRPATRPASLCIGKRLQQAHRLAAFPFGEQMLVKGLHCGMGKAGHWPHRARVLWSGNFPQGGLCGNPETGMEILGILRTLAPLKA